MREHQQTSVLSLRAPEGPWVDGELPDLCVVAQPATHRGLPWLTWGESLEPPWDYRGPHNGPKNVEGFAFLTELAMIHFYCFVDHNQHLKPTWPDTWEFLLQQDRVHRGKVHVDIIEEALHPRGKSAEVIAHNDSWRMRIPVFKRLSHCGGGHAKGEECFFVVVPETKQFTVGFSILS